MPEMPPPAVLVVDDDQNLRRILEAKLQRGPYTVCTVPDVASAVSALEAAQYAVVVLDDRLPNGDSIAALRVLRALAPSAAFVLITAYEDNLMRERAEEAGAQEVLYKPFDLDMLAAVVRSYAPC